MKFISSKELRQKSGKVFEKVKEEDYVITSNGKPVAILTAVTDDLEQQLSALRLAKAEMAVFNMRKRSIQNGLNHLTENEIETEIKAARRDANL